MVDFMGDYNYARPPSSRDKLFWKHLGIIMVNIQEPQVTDQQYQGGGVCRILGTPQALEWNSNLPFHPIALLFHPLCILIDFAKLTHPSTIYICLVHSFFCHNPNPTPSSTEPSTWVGFDTNIGLHHRISCGCAGISCGCTVISCGCTEELKIKV